MSETTIMSPEDAVAATPIKFDIKVCLTAIAKAPIEVCWEVIADQRAGWRPHLAKVDLISEGEDKPTGLGAVHGLWRMPVSMDGEGTVLHEELAEDAPPQVVDVANHYWPPYLYGTKVFGFAPEGSLEHSQQVFIFIPVEGGTEIRVHSTGVLTKAAHEAGMVEEVNRLAQQHSKAVLDSNVEACEARARELGLA